MKNRFEILFLVLVVLFGLSGFVLADISSGGIDVSSLGDYAGEYRVNADQPENTNNCTMNSMEGAQSPDTQLEDPNNWAAIAPQPFVDDVWDVSNPVPNDGVDIPSPHYYPDNYAPQDPGPGQSTPEPATILLVCAGMCGLLPFARRNRSKLS
ncbi:MAG: PEP-CTERM sorting domain-containing protein [Planctomycetaceae bacterium]|nr:PEP-CTERM sorting domain-containing protein [Planctomycetaceae bacterium]